MTDQAVFNKVARHLLKQGKRSLSETGACAYRGIDGLKCAIGCLIPDSDYSKNLEGKSLFNLRRLGHTFPGDHELLLQLQWLHDAVGPDHWRAEMESIANKFSLKWVIK